MAALLFSVFCFDAPGAALPRFSSSAAWTWQPRPPNPRSWCTRPAPRLRPQRLHQQALAETAMGEGSDLDEEEQEDLANIRARKRQVRRRSFCGFCWGVWCCLPCTAKGGGGGPAAAWQCSCLRSCTRAVWCLGNERCSKHAEQQASWPFAGRCSCHIFCVSCSMPLWLTAPC